MIRPPWLRVALLLAAAFLIAACEGDSRDRTGGSTASVRWVDQVPTDTNDVCTMFKQNLHWRAGLEAASRKWGTPPDVKMAIIWQESRFRARARGQGSSAFGYPQAVDGTWAWYQEANNRSRARRDNFADAVDFVGWYMSRSEKVTGISMRDTYNQYLAYHEGHGGYRRGSYRSKRWLLDVARRVENQAETYARQLRSCR